MLNFQVDLIDTDLRAMKTVELRKLAAQGGLKGQSSARKEHLLGLLEPIQLAQVENMEKVAAQRAEQLAAEQAEKDLAEQDMTEVEAHKDALVAKLSDEEAAKKARRSRRGMVIVAKGTEIHKSATFKQVAEANGWTVTIDVTARMVEEDGEFYEIECYTATAEQKGSIVVGSWVGRAWDYAGASAGVGGKARKVRNLKEATRILRGEA
jgi:hypothetical protein